MGRKLPATVPDVPAPGPDEMVERTYEIRLVTPMFGGGVKAGEPDSLMPFRASSIRGHLRFWWRATCGACLEPNELFERESQIWGNVTAPSRVDVAVLNARAANPVSCAQYRLNHAGKQRLNWNPPFQNSALQYVAFPFQGESPARGAAAKPPAKMIENGTFELRIRMPMEFETEVTAALKFWIAFGGLGARTRRGCGSLYSAELSPTDRTAASLRRWIETSYGGYALSGTPRSWPTFAESVKVGSAAKVIAAWNDAILPLRDFRQGVEIGRNPSDEKPAGRSRYPEPETIRQCTKTHSPRHKRQESIPNDAVPRAAFGMPIIFHFIDKASGDPPDTELAPSAECSRMASPLILKALAIGPDVALPIALRFRTEPLNSAVLKMQNQVKGTFDVSCITHERLSRYNNSPMEGLSVKGCVLEAFMNFLDWETVL